MQRHEHCQLLGSRASTRLTEQGQTSTGPMAGSPPGLSHCRAAPELPRPEQQPPRQLQSSLLWPQGKDPQATGAGSGLQPCMSPKQRNPAAPVTQASPPARSTPTCGQLQLRILPGSKAALHGSVPVTVEPVPATGEEGSLSWGRPGPPAPGLHALLSTVEMGTGQHRQKPRCPPHQATKPNHPGPVPTC